MDCSCQAPLSMGFSWQEYWCGLPFSSPGELPSPGIKPGSPVLQAAAALLSEPPGKPLNIPLFWLFTNVWMDIWVVPSLELGEYSCTNCTVGTSLCIFWSYLWKWSQRVSIYLPLWGVGKLFSKVTVAPCSRYSAGMQRCFLLVSSCVLWRWASFPVLIVHQDSFCEACIQVTDFYIVWLLQWLLKVVFLFTNPLSFVCIANIFSLAIACLFTLIASSWWEGLNFGKAYFFGHMLWHVGSHFPDQGWNPSVEAQP